MFNVMFSQACVSHSVHGGRVCSAKVYAAEDCDLRVTRGLFHPFEQKGPGLYNQVFCVLYTTSNPFHSNLI